jgi:hypothetical protein
MVQKFLEVHELLEVWVAGQVQEVSEVLLAADVQEVSKVWVAGRKGSSGGICRTRDIGDVGDIGCLFFPPPTMRQQCPSSVKTELLRNSRNSTFPQKILYTNLRWMLNYEANQPKELRSSQNPRNSRKGGCGVGFAFGFGCG